MENREDFNVEINENTIIDIKSDIDESDNDSDYLPDEKPKKKLVLKKKKKRVTLKKKSPVSSKKIADEFKKNVEDTHL